MRLRVITWNCNMALHLKFERLLSLHPDIAVVQECADPALDTAWGREQPYAGHEWTGFNSKKGLGIFTFGDLRPARDPSYSEAFALYLPVTVDLPARFGGPSSLHVLGVWAVPKAPAGTTKNPRAALQHYMRFLGGGHALVAGDFNMLPQQMTHNSAGENGQSISALLGTAGLQDADSVADSLWPGRPLKRTHFHQRKPRRGFVNDYVFVPQTAADPAGPGVRLAGFEVLDPHDWITWSDHVPLIVDLELPG